MQRKFKYILVALTLVFLIPGTAGCSIAPGLPSTSHQATPPQDNNPTEHINPSWTFPSESSSTITPLPDFPPVIAEVMPSVVSVTTEMVVYDFFGQPHTEYAAGSGVIIDEEGYIATNNHVIQGAGSIEVELHDGRTFPAEIVGTDALTDLSVIKINVANLPHIPWGNSSQLAIGDWVIAIGNALGEGISACQGIISRLDVPINVEGNTLHGLIQTTAAINPGNSGGPLVNMAGQVIGITSAKIASVGIEGMGYAISSNSAKPIIEDLVHQGYVIRPWLGVELYTVNPFVAAANNLSVNQGALVTRTFPGSPAVQAGLTEGDVIVRFDDKEITNRNDLVLAIHSCQIGQGTEIIFVRGKDTKTTIVYLQEIPSPWG